MQVTIIDYGVGNLRSVASAFEYVGAKTIVTNDPEAVIRAECLVLPGVGAFGNAMALLRQRGFVDALDNAVRLRRVPFLGICLGMQLLADTSEEFGHHEGLGWIPGVVSPITSPRVRLPHIGFNYVTPVASTALFDPLPSPSEFYFVHSFRFVPEDSRDVVATTQYGDEFVSAIRRDNIMGVQFHPEKSQSNGLQLLGNFLKLATRI